METREGEGDKGERKERRKKRRKGEGISHTLGESGTTKQSHQHVTLKLPVHKMSDSYGVLGGNAHTHTQHTKTACVSLPAGSK